MKWGENSAKVVINPRVKEVTEGIPDWATHLEEPHKHIYDKRSGKS